MDSNKALYTDICGKHQAVPVFAQPWWLGAVCDKWEVVLAKKGEHVIGAWPYPVESKMGIPMIRTPRLTPYLGPVVFLPPDIKSTNMDSFEHEAVSGLMKQVPKTPVWNLALQPGLNQAGVFHGAGLTTTVRQTFLLPLDAPEEALLGQMKETMRRNIRQSEAELEIVRDNSCIKDLYRFHKHTLGKKNKELAYTEKDMAALLAACDKHDAGCVWVARSGSQIQAAIWQVWDATRSYYFMGGQNPEAQGYKAMSVLLWHAIKTARARGLKTFDFEGSMDAGVERFFRGFGGTRTLYMVLQKNTSPLWQLKTKMLG